MISLSFITKSTKLLLNQIYLLFILIDIFILFFFTQSGQGSPIFEIGVCKSIADNGQPLKIDCTQEPNIFCCRQSYSKNSLKYCCDRQTYLKNIQRYLASILFAGSLAVFGTLIILVLTALTTYLKSTTPRIALTKDTTTTKSKSKSQIATEKPTSTEKIIAELKSRLIRTKDRFQKKATKNIKIVSKEEESQEKLNAITNCRLGNKVSIENEPERANEICRGDHKVTRTDSKLCRKQNGRKFKTYIKEDQIKKDNFEQFMTSLKCVKSKDKVGVFSITKSTNSDKVFNLNPTSNSPKSCEVKQKILVEMLPKKKRRSKSKVKSRSKSKDKKRSSKSKKQKKEDNKKELKSWPSDKRIKKGVVIAKQKEEDKSIPMPLQMRPSLEGSTYTIPEQPPTPLPGPLPESLLESLPGSLPDPLPGTLPKPLPGTLPGPLPGPLPDRLPEPMQERLPERRSPPHGQDMKSELSGEFSSSSSSDEENEQSKVSPKTIFSNW